jgi:zinc transport system permease protein
MFEILHYEFMQRALIIGVILAALLAFIGVFVVLKKMSFFSDGIAHASLAGIAIGILLSVSPLITAIIFSVIFAIFIFILEKKTKLSSDAIIGLIFTSGMALGVILLNFKQGYQPELISFLFGNILAIQQSELIITIIFSAIVGLFLILNYKKIALMVLNEDMAYISGINVNILQLALYIILTISVVLGIKMLGIVLISALLIIPVSISKLISNSFKKLIILSIIFSEITVISGITMSYYFDTPTGPTIVLTGIGLLLITIFFKEFRKLF